MSDPGGVRTGFISPAVRFEHVDKIFNKDSVNEITLFRDFSLHIKEHEFITVVGSNGSGKTTLLNLLCGSVRADAGKIFLKNKDVTGLKEHRRAAFIGRVFQDPAKGTCPDLTVLENLSLAGNKGKRYGLGSGVNKKQIDDYRSRLELLHLGLEDKLGLPVGLLSGGQRQALALLICAMAPIDLLVLDEHTAALDPKASETVMELTNRLVLEKRVTTVMVTHNLKFAVNYGDRILMMHQGRCAIDAGEAQKQKYGVPELLKVFHEISAECGGTAG